MTAPAGKEEKPEIMTYVLNQPHLVALAPVSYPASVSLYQLTDVHGVGIYVELALPGAFVGRHDFSGMLDVLVISIVELVRHKALQLVYLLEFFGRAGAEFLNRTLAISLRRNGTCEEENHTYHKNLFQVGIRHDNTVHLPSENLPQVPNCKRYCGLTL